MRLQCFDFQRRVSRGVCGKGSRGELGKRGRLISRANKIAEEPLLERWGGVGRGYSTGTGTAAAGPPPCSTKH